MKKIAILIFVISLIGTLTFGGSTKKRYTYFSTSATKTDSDAGYWIYNGLNGIEKNYVTTDKSKNATEAASGKGVTWNSSGYANFPNLAYVTIKNPLEGVSEDTGFSITCDFYNDTSNTNWERLFDLSDGTCRKYFMINAGRNIVYQNHMLLEAAYLEATSGDAQEANKYRIILKDQTKNYQDGQWHSLTLKVAKGGYMYLYIDGSLVSSNTDSSCIPTGFGSKDLLTKVMNSITSYTTGYVGTSIFQIIYHNDGFFTGRIRNYTFINTSEVFTIDYNTNGSSSSYNSEVSAFIPDNLPTPTAPDGFTFDCWCTDKALTTPAVAGKFVDSNTTLYARFVHTHTDGTKYYGTSTLPTPAAGNWALTTAVTSGTISSNVNLCVTRNITTLTQSEGALSINIDAGSSYSVETLNQSGGTLSLHSIKVTNANITGGTNFTVTGLVNISSLKLGSGKLITLGSGFDAGSEITLSSSTAEGVVTSGFGANSLGTIINLPAGATEYMLMKTKTGEIKVIRHKSDW